MPSAASTVDAGAFSPSLSPSLSPFAAILNSLRNAVIGVDRLALPDGL